MDLVGERTRALQAKLLGEFERWLAENLSAPARTSVDSSAMVFCSVLRAYGNHLYMTGQPLYKWRRLCAFCQKNRLLLRPYMPLCWDLVTRWERICPTVHRNPVPLSVAKAMMSLALGWGWPRMVAVIGLPFHGVARVGEHLGAVRSCLLLPCDILEEETSSLYVWVEKPKTGNRGSGRVQHFVVREPDFVFFAQDGSDAPEAPLCGASPSAFGRRWDRLTTALGIPPTLGGAVHLYQRQVPLTEIMVRMQIRHLSTLEAYLQETSAVSIIPALPEESRDRIKAASSLLRPQLISYVG